MPEETQPGIFSYSYHLTLREHATQKPTKAAVSAWLLDRVKELELDGVQCQRV